MSHHPLTAKQRQTLYRTLVLMLAGVPKEERMARHAAAEVSYRAHKAANRETYRATLRARAVTQRAWEIL